MRPPCPLWPPERVAGLRPYRRSGFVVKTETLGRKTVVHNYGHGGAAGLSVARLLQQRGFTVTIYTEDLPPNTTSNVAGGLWEPVSLFDPDFATPDFQDQFVRAARFSHRYFQGLAGDDYGARRYSRARRLDARPRSRSDHSDRPGQPRSIRWNAKLIASGTRRLPRVSNLQ